MAAQPWCNGRVGLFRIAWGGFNASQIAAHRPPALRAIISACSTDDGYADDVHYIGDAVLAQDMLGWAAQFTRAQRLAPNSQVRAADWRACWLARLDATPQLVARWLAHPLRDAYWQQGSVCEDFAAIAGPVFVPAGWADAYTMLTKGKEYVDKRQAYDEQRYRSRVLHQLETRSDARNDASRL